MKSLLKDKPKRFLAINIAAMAVVVLLFILALNFGLSLYTMHGQAVAVPNLHHKTMEEAEQLLEEAGLPYEITATGYVKSLPANCILDQSPAAGVRVKPGHLILLTANDAECPTLTFPDIIDNSSMREAMANLKAIGFKVGQPQYVDGEKDWVYGALVGSKHVFNGEKIPSDKIVIIQVGSGSVSYADEDINYIGEDVAVDDIDEFEVVTGPDVMIAQ